MNETATLPAVAFPLYIKQIPTSVLEEFAHSESGAHEDALEARRTAIDSNVPVRLTAYEILTRYRTMIEIRDALEADRVYYAACSGTFQLTREGSGDPERPRAWNNWARRIADILRPYAAADTVRMFPTADGN